MNSDGETLNSDGKALNSDDEALNSDDEALNFADEALNSDSEALNSKRRTFYSIDAAQSKTVEVAHDVNQLPFDEPVAIGGLLPQSCKLGGL